MILKKVKAEKRESYFRWMGAAAQLALLAAIALSRLEVPHSDFIQGLLMGYSVVGNLVTICLFGQKIRGDKNVRS